MIFSAQSQRVAGVAVIHCEGRLVVSEGVRLLQEEVEKHTLETKKYLLDLGAVSYVDSAAWERWCGCWVRCGRIEET
jgi:anti-anti-sigma regulatory factor